MSKFTNLRQFSRSVDRGELHIANEPPGLLELMKTAKKLHEGRIKRLMTRDELQELITLAQEIYSRGK